VGLVAYADPNCPQEVRHYGPVGLGVSRESIRAGAEDGEHHQEPRHPKEARQPAMT
jgi:hypothetical protein